MIFWKHDLADHGMQSTRHLKQWAPFLTAHLSFMCESSEGKYILCKESKKGSNEWGGIQTQSRLPYRSKATVNSFEKI